MKQIVWAVLACGVATAAYAAPLNFDEGFEGDLSTWAFVVDGTNTLSATGSPHVWDGARSLHVAYAGGARAYYSKSLPAQSGGSVFVRGWVYVPSASVANLPVGSTVRILEAAGISDRFYLRLTRANGLVGLKAEAVFPSLSLIVGGSLQAAQLTPDTWHRVEFGYDGAAQQVKLYIDDTVQVRDSLAASGTSMTLDRFNVGLIEVTGTPGAFSFALDAVALTGGVLGTARSLNQISHEFEGTGLTVFDNPPGKAGLAISAGTLSVTTDAVAAHRGTRGLRVIDGDGTTPGQFSALFGEVTANSAAHLRTWWKPASVEAAGELTLLALHSSTAFIQPADAFSLAVAAIKVDATGKLLLETSSDLGAKAQTTAQTVPPSADGWHLLELTITGGGSSTGIAQAYLDGNLFGIASGIAWTSAQVDGWSLGELLRTAAFRGESHYDDARVSRAILPSAFGFITPGSLQQGTCTEVQLSANTSTGAIGRAPEAVTIELAMVGATGPVFFRDPGCAQSINSFDFPAGANLKTLYVRVTSGGIANFTATAPDYLAGAANLPVTTSVTIAPGPTNLRADANPHGPGPVTVEWDSPPGGMVSDYSVFWSDGTGTTGPITATPGSQLVTFDPVEGAVNVVVIVNYADGRLSEASDGTLNLTVDETPPPVPEAPAVAFDPASNLVTLSWRGVTDGITSTTGYTLARTVNGGPLLESVTDTNGYQFTLTVTGEYAFEVSATDAVGNASLFSPATLVTLPPAAPAELAISGIPARVRAGTPVDFTLSALDGTGAIADTYGGLVSFQVQGGTASLEPEDYRFTAADAGVHAFVGRLRFDEPGTYAFIAQDPSNPSLRVEVEIVVFPEDTVQPQFISSPNTRGVVGVPYRVTSTGAVKAVGGGTLEYGLCGMPPSGFLLETNTGRVDWTPTTTGAFPICISATNEVGTVNQSFTVQVSATPVEVVARLIVSPSRSGAPAVVTFDASSSTTSGLVLSYRWRFGDGAGAETEGPIATHTFALPGTYRTEVIVFDAQGTQDAAYAFVEVTDAQGRVPPSAAIIASAQSDAGALTATFTCDCSAGVVAYAWDVAGGGVDTGASFTHTFGPGRYQVRLTVADANGLTASDTVEVFVTGEGAAVPPYCAPTVDPSAGPAPLAVSHVANGVPGTHPIAKVEWSVEGTILSGDSVQFTYPSAGWTVAAVKVTDSAGLTCRAALPIAVTGEESEVPPAFLAPFLSAELACGETFTHLPQVIGAQPRTFTSLGAPSGMEVDPTTGKVTWRPTPFQSNADAGEVVVRIIVDVNGVTSHQELYLTVSSCTEAQLEICGCGASGSATPLLAFALLGLSRLWRRRRAA